MRLVCNDTRDCSTDSRAADTTDYNSQCSDNTQIYSNNFGDTTTFFFIVIGRLLMEVIGWLMRLFDVDDIFNIEGST